MYFIEFHCGYSIKLKILNVNQSICFQKKTDYLFSNISKQTNNNVDDNKNKCQRHINISIQKNYENVENDVSDTTTYR